MMSCFLHHKTTVSTLFFVNLAVSGQPVFLRITLQGSNPNYSEKKLKESLVGEKICRTEVFLVWKFWKRKSDNQGRSEKVIREKEGGNKKVRKKGFPGSLADFALGIDNMQEE